MTLYELLGVTETVPPGMVESAALVETGGVATAEQRAALAVLADPAARADYDARIDQGLPFELALAWGVAAFAAGDSSTARYHWERAARIAPDDHAVPKLLSTVADAPLEPTVTIPDDLRARARAEIERVRQNSAFPHRLIRYASTLAAETDETTGEGEAPVVAGASRELLQYDIVEAPRAYAMILPVLREHYPAVWALDAPFFEATMSVLERHTPQAEYERKLRGPRRSETSDTGPMDLPPMELPPLRIPEPSGRGPRMMALPNLPPPGYAWVGALLGAILAAEDGLPGIVTGALLGFLIAYAIVFFRSRR